jgi:hypothetical protein
MGSEEKIVRRSDTSWERRILRAVTRAGFLSVLFVSIISCTTLPPALQDSQARTVFEIISGTIKYPNDLYFPSRIRIEISLTAENRFTQEQRQLVVQTIRNPQRFPVNFILRYAQAEVLAQDMHSISVRVYQEDSTTPYLQSARTPILLTSPPIDTVLIDLVQIR